MPAPATTEQLLVNLRKSGLIGTVQLDTALLAAPFDESPSRFLDRIVERGMLTRYQADKIASGKYRGFVLGPYVIQDRLGGGGMGHVFLAEHTGMKRHVALKVLSIASANDEVARERFFREARVAAGLDHPYIVRVYDMRQEDAICYLVMEYIDGNSLQAIVAEQGPIPWQSAVHFAYQIALGLQHAHENGLVHRDIKPANLLLARDGTVRIIDLGLVRWDMEADSKLTEKVDQSILGTADYLAPEQAVNSSTVDIRADIYSLGATFYYLVAGRTLFPDGKTAQKLMWQQMKQPTPLRDLVPDLPEDLAAIMHKCLSKLPGDRYSHPAELAEVLAPWLQGSSPEIQSDWFPKSSRRGLSGPGTPRSGLNAPPDSRLIPRRNVMESTMMPPLNDSRPGRASHLFTQSADNGNSSMTPTLAEMNGETPRRMTKPVNPALMSRVYVPEQDLDGEMRVIAPPPPASPWVWILVGMVLAFSAVGLVLIAKPF